MATIHSYQHERTPLTGTVEEPTVLGNQPKWWGWKVIGGGVLLLGCLSLGVKVRNIINPRSIFGFQRFLIVQQFQQQHQVHPESLESSFVRGDSQQGNRPLYRLCEKNSQCKSGLCCLGACQPCCQSTDCPSEPMKPHPPGEFGSCHTVGRTGKKKCIAYKNRKATQIPPEGYPVWIPIKEDLEVEKLVMPRTVRDEKGPVTEMAWYFDLKDQPDKSVLDGITVNETHIMIPLYQQMLAGYSRKYKTYNEEETGIVTAAYLPNKVSVVTQRPKAGMIEKYHALTYSPMAQFSTSRGKWMRKKNEDFMSTPEGKTFDITQFAGRLDGRALAWGQTGIIDSYVEAGIDQAHLWQVRRYAKSVDKAQETPSRSAWKHHADLAMQAISYAKDINFMSSNDRVKKSENHCKHFEDGTGVDYSTTHIIIPLDTPITTLSGEMVYSPMYYLGLSSGYNVVHYDEKTKILQMFYQAFNQARQYSDVEHQDDQPNPSGLWLSPVADGDDYKVPDHDGRNDFELILDKPKFKFSNFLTGLLGLNPGHADSVFARPMANTCEQEYMQDDWESILLKGDGDTAFQQLVKDSDLVKVSNRGAPCGGIYMRNDYGNITNGFGVNEFGVWNHLLLEVKSGHKKALATADWWDEWECFYGKTDSAQCKAG